LLIRIALLRGQGQPVLLQWLDDQPCVHAWKTHPDSDLGCVVRLLAPRLARGVLDSLRPTPYAQWSHETVVCA
jgi:hypothetical protein